MNPDFQNETWKQTGPSYIQSYVVSAFILVGLLCVAHYRTPLTPLTGLVFAVWFGFLFYMLIQNWRAERTFASNRITVADGRLTHSFRYAVTEAEFSTMDVNDIVEMKVHSGEPGEMIAVELIGAADSDFFLLPDEVQVNRLQSTLQRLNPAIRITR
jgi:hypothetical protein